MVKEMLADANRVKREPVPASHLIVGLQCGGSDGYSGISANPALGAAVDRLVRHGGTAILSETPEVYGAEHLLTRRAVSREVGEKLLARIAWWEDYCARNGAAMDNNPSAGNKVGGLTTILEKSLGAVAKGGTTNLVDVYEYAQRIDAKGFVFMDSPGYDPMSATGQVASGANLICFTTGRGSAYGCAPSPSLKLATNTALWERQEDDMDINCGGVIDGSAIDRTTRRSDFPDDARLRVGRGVEERTARIRAERVRALAGGRGDLSCRCSRRDERSRLGFMAASFFYQCAGRCAFLRASGAAACCAIICNASGFGDFDAVDRRRINPAGVSRALARRIQAVDVDALIVVLATHANRRRRARLDAGQHRVVHRKARDLLVELRAALRGSPRSRSRAARC